MPSAWTIRLAATGDMEAIGHRAKRVKTEHRATVEVVSRLAGQKCACAKPRKSAEAMNIDIDFSSAPSDRCVLHSGSLCFCRSTSTSSGSDWLRGRPYTKSSDTHTQSIIRPCDEARSKRLTKQPPPHTTASPRMTEIAERLNHRFENQRPSKGKVRNDTGRLEAEEKETSQGRVGRHLAHRTIPGEESHRSGLPFSAQPPTTPGRLEAGEKETGQGRAGRHLAHRTIPGEENHPSGLSFNAQPHRGGSKRGGKKPAKVESEDSKGISEDSEREKKEAMEEEWRGPSGTRDVEPPERRKPWRTGTTRIGVMEGSVDQSSIERVARGRMRAKGPTGEIKFIYGGRNPLDIFPTSLGTLHLTRFEEVSENILDALEHLLEHKSSYQIPSLESLILEDGVGSLGVTPAKNLELWYDGGLKTPIDDLPEIAAAHDVSVYFIDETDDDEVAGTDE
ncbi:hypothetical protein MMC07_007509 [Pseudocyphellaria aurata]|nr:hypothetical protein [Pseudocyphellaria aurata]